MITISRNGLLLGICLLLGSCATPSSPTGGPPDEEGPEIISTEPETGATNVDGRKVVLHFSEFVERSSLTEALVIEPQLGLVYDIDWGRKSVAIEFDEALPDSTTIIVTVGTDFTDMNNNKLANPYKVAFSTGETIDEGKLTARVLDARTGKGTEGRRILLYRTPVDLELPANYIGESDTSGTVQFSYLRQGRYKAFWVDDRNRNRIWDPQQERAQPFSDEFVSLEKAAEDTLGTLFIARSDTSRPALQGVGLFSSQRMRLRFSENVALTDSTRIRVRDSTGTAAGKAYPLYVLPSEPYVMFAHNTEPLSPDRSYRLDMRNIADAAGNVQPLDTLSFTGSAQEDTTSQRIVGTSVDEGIFPDESVRVAYAAPITSASIRDSLKVVAGDTVYSSWSNLEIYQNEVRVLPDTTWREGIEYEIRFWNPMVQNFNAVSPTVWQESDLGALNITFADTSGNEPVSQAHLSLKTEQGRMVLDTTFTGSLEIPDLAPVNHQVIIYRDENGNGQWDAGTVAPFAAPEPYFIRNDIPIQRGFTADLAVRFRD